MEPIGQHIKHLDRKKVMDLITRREYFLMRLMISEGVSPSLALEAISSTAIEHPEWDMEERRTFQEWCNE